MGATGIPPGRVDNVVRVLRSMPRDEIDRMLWDAARAFGSAFGMGVSQATDERMRARIATMSTAEVAALIAPLVRLSETATKESQRAGNRGVHAFNRGHF